MHAAGEDLRICLLRTGELPQRSSTSRWPPDWSGLNYPLSLVNLVGQVKDDEPYRERNTYRLAASAARPWPSSDYAVDDVRHLLDLADEFHDRLTQLGRSDRAKRRVRRSSSSRLPGAADQAAPATVTGPASAQPPQSRNGRAGSPTGRENEARRQNRPLRQDVRDELFVAIAGLTTSQSADLEPSAL